MPAKLIDVSGQKFGRLTALSYTGKAGRFKWLCICECGNEARVSGHQLRSGQTRSCGCLDSEVVAERNRTHGLSQSLEYAAYHHMIRRCAGRGENAHYYADRGIAVCDRWMHGESGLSGFECFMADMGEKPEMELSIDRIDNDAGYSPENCRWATKVVQSRNRRSARIVEYQGREMSLAEAAELAGIPYHVVHDRVDKLGWSSDDALNKKTVGRWQ